VTVAPPPGGDEWPRGAAKLLRLAVLALVATLPFAIEPIYQRLSFSQAYYLKFAALTIGLFAIVVIVALRLPLQRPSAVFWAYLVYLAIVLLSVIVHPVRAYGFAQALFPLSGAVVIFILEVVPTRRRDQESLFLLLVAVGFVSALYGILQNFGIEMIKRAELETERQVLVSFFGHSNFMASFLGPIVFIAAYFVGRDTGRGLKIFALATIVAILVCLYWAGTRAATVALAAGALSLLSHLRHRIAWDRRQVRTGAAIALGLFVAATLWGQYGGRHRETLLRRISSHREISDRLFLWLVGIEMIRDHPVLGIGYGRYNAEFWPYCERFVKRPGNEIYSYILREMRGLNPGEAHNDPLETACETGLLGVGAFLALWIFALLFCHEILHRGPPEDRRLGLFLRAALVFVLVDSLFGFPLQLPASGLLFWLLLGSVAQTHRRTAAPQAESPDGEIEPPDHGDAAQPEV